MEWSQRRRMVWWLLATLLTFRLFHPVGVPGHPQGWRFVDPLRPLFLSYPLDRSPSLLSLSLSFPPNSILFSKVLLWPPMAGSTCSPPIPLEGIRHAMRCQISAARCTIGGNDVSYVSHVRYVSYVRYVSHVSHVSITSRKDRRQQSVA